MIGTFNVGSCSERFVFHSFYKIPSAKCCEGSKSHPVKDMEVFQISESGCFKRIQKTTNMMQKDAMIQSISNVPPKLAHKWWSHSFLEILPTLSPPHADLVEKFHLFNRGFLHRLDVPSSGLILAAKSFESYYDLQVPLWNGKAVTNYAPTKTQRTRERSSKKI